MHQTYALVGPETQPFETHKITPLDLLPWNLLNSAFLLTMELDFETYAYYLIGNIFTLSLWILCYSFGGTSTSYLLNLISPITSRTVCAAERKRSRSTVGSLSRTVSNYKKLIEAKVYLS